ncbi:hypothetical protein [Archaeoglobus sp.]
MMKKIVESGIRIVDRITGGFPIPSFVTVVVDPLATPELLIYGMCDYYVPNFKSKDVVVREAETLGYNIEVVDLDKIKDLRECRVCVEFEGDFRMALELREIAYSNNLIINAIVLKDQYEDGELSRLMYVSDGVVVVESEKVGERFIFKFAIPKMVGGYAIPNYVRFKTERSVLEIDTSRDIV